MPMPQDAEEQLAMQIKSLVNDPIRRAVIEGCAEAATRRQIALRISKSKVHVRNIELDLRKRFGWESREQMCVALARLRWCGML
jgi:hypothetical protein